MKTIDERILALEASVRSPIAGTQIVRVMNPDAPGVQWCIGIGGLSMPKEFFYGPSIDAALSTAEQEIYGRIANGGKAVVTEMDKLGEAMDEACFISAKD